MKPLTDLNIINNLKYNDLVHFECEHCHNKFSVLQKYVKSHIKNKNNPLCFCSTKCAGLSKSTGLNCVCKYCDKPFYKRLNQIKITKNNFCSNKCAGKYNSAHKTTGTRRSKLEVWLEQQLGKLYPNLPIDYNKTSAINAELDIYIPSLKLAIELNGVFHYEPIFGKDKLNSTQNNDKRKFAACSESGISLCIIDTSKQVYFKESTCIPYLNIITNIINSKLVDVKVISTSFSA